MRHAVLSLTISVLLSITASAAIGEPDEQTERRISNIINGLQPLGAIRDRLRPKATLAERMLHYQTPGVSITIINEYQVEWAKGFGVKEWGNSAPISTQTLFQAASISKMVFAVAVMILVEQGDLDLDRDINDYLQSTKVPSNGEWQPIVTLRQILSHSAGFTVSGFPGYSSKDSLPSILDVLQGRSPSKTGKVEVNIFPELQSRYSGGGTLFAQVAVTDALQRNFSELMREVVLEPLTMRDSTFEQPLPRSRRKQAATGHPWHHRALEGKWKTFPEQAAAGLWTTPTDLAKLGIMLQRVLRGDRTQVISSNAVADMLRAPTDEKIGLGVFLEGKGENERFGHGGWNDGFTCEMKLYRNFGIGAVVMVNSNQGSELINEILNAIAEEYSWPGYRSKQLPRTEMAESIQKEALVPYLGAYEIRPGLRLRLSFVDDRLTMTVGKQPELILHPESPTEFFSRVVNAGIKLSPDESGERKVILRQDGRDFELKKIAAPFDSAVTEH